MLILDHFANLAESDTETYTHSLMNKPHENYKVKKNEIHIKYAQGEPFLQFSISG